jgi:hypothetical protein
MGSSHGETSIRGFDTNAAELTPALRPHLAPGARVDLTKYGNSLSGSLDTSDPIALVPTLVDFALSRQLRVWIWPHPPNPLRSALGRIAEDLGRKR